MLTEICQELKNWFCHEIHIGEFTIVDGELADVEFLEGQYYRIVGSILNDGVHYYDDVLRDETFEGAVWMMAIPPSFLDLVDKIEAWTVDNADALNGPYQSESFGGYSYSKATGGQGGQHAYSWQNAFGADLNRWRKI